MKVLLLAAACAGGLAGAVLLPDVCRGASLADAVPEPDAHTFIWDNRIVLRFSELPVVYGVDVIDANGCKVSERVVRGEGNRLIVHMRACERTGYAPGHMHVQWKVNGKEGQYHLHIKAHH